MVRSGKPALLALAGLALAGCTSAPPPGVGVWHLTEPAAVTPSSVSVALGVQRLECSSGVTGDVLDPVVTYEDDRVVISTPVAPLPEGGYDCSGNDTVVIEVRLDEPLGDRELVDAACAEERAAATVFCDDAGIRWSPEAVACPDGLLPALEAHLRGQPVGGVLPTDVRVRAFPEGVRFAADLIDDLVGCRFRTELLIGKDLHTQLWLIPAGFNALSLERELRDAGGSRPFPDTGPHAWQGADPTDAVGLFPGGAVPHPALGFGDWGSYLDGADVLLVGAERI